MPALRNLRKLENTVWAALDGRERSFQEELKGNYREALNSIRSELSGLYEKHAVNGKLTRAQMTKYNRMAKLEKEINRIIGETASKNTSSFKRLKKEQYSGSFFRHQWSVEQHAGVGLSWGTINERMIEEAVDNDMLKIATERLRTNGRQRLKREITQGLIRGDSYDKMARKVKSAINGNATDAMRIARTEGQKAAVKGQQDSYKDAEESAGLDMRQRWDATLDGRTRPRHGKLDGKYKNEEKGGWYVPGLGYVPGPLQSGSPSFDINCRCRVSGEVADYPPKVRRTREGGLQDYETYEEWAKKRGLEKNDYGQRIFPKKKRKSSGGSAKEKADYSRVWKNQSENVKNKMESAFAPGMTPELSRVMNKTPGVRAITGRGRGYYDPDNKKINAGQGYDPDTIRHEMGHHVEHNMLDGVTRVSIAKSMQGYGKKFTTKGFLNKDGMRLQDEIRANFPDDVDLQDYFGSVTKNTVGMGHPMKYYKQPDSVTGNVEIVDGVYSRGMREAFANMFGIYAREDKSAWQLIKKETPDIARRFEEWIEKF